VAATTYTGEDVIRAFEEATGDRPLVRASFRGEVVSFMLWDRNDGPLEWGFYPPGMKEKCGDFTIYVFAEPSQRKERLGRDRKDERGIYWYLDHSERGPRAEWPGGSHRSRTARTSS
jgi:hypothetical protein